MDTIKVILIVILAIALWVLYHKLFNVIYFDAITALFREIVICLLIAGFVVLKGCGAIEGAFQKDNCPKLDYLGSYYNLNLLNGSGTDAWIILTESESSKEKINISGYAYVIKGNYSISFDEDIPIPTDNTFTYRDVEHGLTITGTINEKEKKLFVTQESPSNIVDLYSGEYVDNDTWEGLLEERRQAINAAEIAMEPNHWIEEYFGYYIPITEYYDEDKFILIDFNNWSSSTFNFILYQGGDMFAKQHAIEIPYPLGPEVTGTIEYEDAEDHISFSVLGLSDDGRQIIEITNCSFPEYIGQFIAAPETSDEPSDPTTEETDAPSDIPAEPEDFMENTDEFIELVPEYSEPQDPNTDIAEPAILWDGTYTCHNGGEDGIKTLDITQVDANKLTFYIYHEYANGRIEDYLGDAEIGTYGNGAGFASFEHDIVLYFTLKDNAIEVSQVGIYPAVDLEFSGSYVRQITQ